METNGEFDADGFATLATLGAFVLRTFRKVSDALQGISKRLDALEGGASRYVIPRPHRAFEDENAVRPTDAVRCPDNVREAMRQLAARPAFDPRTARTYDPGKQYVPSSDSIKRPVDWPRKRAFQATAATEVTSQSNMARLGDIIK